MLAMPLTLAALLATALPLDTRPLDLGANGPSTVTVASASPTLAGDESKPPDDDERKQGGQDDEDGADGQGKGGRGKQGSGSDELSADDRILNA